MNEIISLLTLNNPHKVHDVRYVFILQKLALVDRVDVGTLTRDMKMLQPAMSRAVDRLVEKKLIVRLNRDASDDRRKVLIELTPKGRKFVGDIA